MSHVTLIPPRDKQCDYNKSRASISIKKYINIISEAEAHPVQEKEKKATSLATKFII